MALSASSTPTTWDRTLPIPTGLQSREMLELARRNSTLLQHHISSDQFLTPTANDPKRRSIVAYSSLGPKCEQDKGMGEDDRSTHRSVSVMSSESISTSSSDGLIAQERSGLICICPGESRIPRPRNAFILYRQHQHAVVVAQYPKLPNPDISKIIGEQWRCLTSKDKDEWKALAELEKARHAQQFPDYRYRPRRTSKFHLLENQASAQSQESRCGRCGGKLMKPPNTPHYPAFKHTNMLPVVGIPRPQKRGYSEAFVQQPRQSIVQVAPNSYTAPIRYGFGSGTTPRHDSVHYPVPPPPRPPTLAEDGSEAKRRRLDAAHVGQPLHNTAQYSDYRERGLYHPGQVLRPPMTTPLAPSMAPPSMRPNHAAPSLQTSPRGPMLIHQRRDPNLILPPLKTSSAQPKSTTSAEMQTLNSSLEATIMSYPVLTKLKTLSLITPNCSPSSSCGSIIAIEGLDPSRVYDMTNSLFEQLGKESTFDVRIFAGPNPYQAFPTSCQSNTEDKRADTMTPLKYLNLMQEWHKISQDLRSFVTKQPNTKSIDESADDNRMQGIASQGFGDQHKAVDAFGKQPEKSKRSPISAISPKTIEKTADMTIRSAQSADPSPEDVVDQNQPPTPSWSARLTRSRVPAWKQDKQQPQDELRYQDVNQANSAVVSENAAIPPLPKTPITPPRPVSSPLSPKTNNFKSQQAQSTKIPIALVPHYQLTTVDACSIAFPVTDSYDVLTHWRWHATIWRGCVGPDISVVIKSAPEQQDEETTAAGPADAKRPSNANSGDTSGRSNSITTESQNPAQARDAQSAEPKEPRAPLPPFSVEVRLKDYRAVIVQAAKKSENNSDADREKENELWEKAKRRVGFEVEETLRK